MSTVSACSLSPTSRLLEALPGFGYLDSFEVPTQVSDQSIVSIYAAILGHLPRTFKHLLVARSIIVRPFGISGVTYTELSHPIDTTRCYRVGDKIGRWTVFAIGKDELVTGRNDKHLDFRVSVTREAGKRVVFSTAVMTHNRLGRTYLAAILPFHRFGVRGLLTNAAAAGRI